MGVDVLAFSMNVPTSHWERLSSSLQASTRGVIDFGILECKASNLACRVSTKSRSCLQTQIPRNNKGFLGNSVVESKRIIEKASCRSHFFKCSLARKNQLLWKPFLHGPNEKTGLVGPTSCSSRALVFGENTEEASNPPIGQEKVGVLLLNLGGPETLQDVQPFLFNLFADPAAALMKALEDKNVPAKVYVGMRYWHPFTEEAIERVMIFFSAHGVPVAYVEEAGDPYKAEMEECVDLIMEELKERGINNDYTLAYQFLVPRPQHVNFILWKDYRRRITQADLRN